jgi:glyoxylase-like metal-dependent hydrolase (beta-lactamase superfamily II)
VPEGARDLSGIIKGKRSRSHKKMLQEMVKVIQQGNENGNNMAVTLKLPSGLEIIGLATKNFYGGEWDYGPSWNYVVRCDTPFLLDTGRFGMGGILLDMMGAAGVASHDLDYIIISHGHEDHDGGLYEIVQSTGVKVAAHPIYDRLIRSYPAKAPSVSKKEFPASCWHCFFPEAFSQEHCLVYQRERSKLRIEELKEADTQIGGSFRAYHMPGHSPDALALLVGEEVLFVGDTVLPDITPFPTSEESFYRVNEILGLEYRTAESLYGLRAYIKSLKKLKEIGERLPELLVLPAHRLFHNNQWHELNLVERIDELIEHHIQRCADILKILAQGPKKVKEIVMEYFEEPQLEGVGIYLAENEIRAHLELLGLCGDVKSTEGSRFISSGTTHFASMIQALEP